jgi:hypothetical protein
MQFFSTDDARMRLNGSIIQHEGEFLYVREVGHMNVKLEDGVYRLNYDEPNEIRGAMVSPLTDKDETFILDLDEETFLPFKQPLGYVNLESYTDFPSAILYQRWPVNQTRIGLTSRNSGWFNGGPSFNSSYRYDLGFIKMLNDDYPSFTECLQRIEKVAFSRDFAVNPVTLTARTLLYREEEVGEVSHNKVILYPNGHYLKECLERIFRRDEIEGVEIELFEA